MKGYIHEGRTMEVTAPYAVSSGGGCLVGGLFGFAVTDALISARVQIMTVGVFEHAKLEAQAWSEGDDIYWDDTAKELTTVVGSNTLVGLAAIDAADPTTIGRVRING